jgi:hypothetical protein
VTRGQRKGARIGRRWPGNFGRAPVEVKRAEILRAIAIEVGREIFAGERRDMFGQRTEQLRPRPLAAGVHAVEIGTMRNVRVGFMV